jgi:pimeloyl-ACP methyl ester carboxylesterase
MHSRAEEKRVRVGEVNTSYLKCGEGPPVIMIHGGGGCAEESWSENIEYLAQEHAVYAPDLIGFGNTDEPEIEYSFEILYDFFTQFIESMNIGKASLIGHSLGGAVALRYALEYPEKVDKLMLIDSAGFSDDLGFIGKLAAPVLKLKAAIENNRTFLSMSRNLVKENILFVDRLHEISAPTLIVWGELDGYLPFKLAQEACSTIKNSKLYIFKRCWHAPQRERADEFNHLAAEFLK